MLRNFIKNTSAPQGRHSLAQGASPGSERNQDHAPQGGKILAGFVGPQHSPPCFSTRRLRRISHPTIPAVTTSSTR